MMRNGAPAWVNDTVLNTRCRNGLLSFCYWWSDGDRHRGTTDTACELDEPLPPVWAADRTIQAMVSQTALDTEEQCGRLLAAASDDAATHDNVAVIFVSQPDADIAAAINQLDLAGLLARSAWHESP